MGSFAIVGLALLAYVNSFPGVFLLDDLQIIRDNPLVHEPDLSRIFTTDYWGAESNTGLYRPLTILSFALNRLLLGAGPLGFHLVNVLLHAGVALLVLLVLQRWGVARAPAWLAAAWFAVHPLHTEVVNVVVGRSELLAAGFLLLALLLARSATRRAAAGVSGCFALALLSKEHAIVLLALLPLLDWFFAEDGYWWRRRWPLYLGLLVVAAGWLLLRTWGVARVVAPLPPDPFFTPLVFVPPADRMVSALLLQGSYLWKLLVPWPLQGIYAHADARAVVVDSASPAGIAVAAAACAVIGTIAWGVWRRSLAALFALLYLLSFAPTSNFFFPAGVTFAERLAYFPSIWFCAALAVGAQTLASRHTVFTRARFLAVAYGLALLVVTLARNPEFASDVRLWEANVQTAPRNPLALMYLASSYAEVGRSAEAEATYRRLVEVAPEFPDGLRNYAGFLLDSDRAAEAIPVAERATRVKIGKSPLSYLILAEAHYRLGDFARAREALTALGTDYAHYWYFWALSGMVHEAVGEDRQAVEAYRKAQPWPPESDLPLRLGLLLLRQGQAIEAEPLLRAATEQAAADAKGWNGLGVSLAMQGRSAEAAQAFRRAVELAPDAQPYRENYRKAVELSGGR